MLNTYNLNRIVEFQVYLPYINHLQGIMLFKVIITI